MAISMAAMMAPTAVPFFVAYGRDARRPASVVLALLIYAGVWAVLGAAAGLLMNQLMIPMTLTLVGASLAFAVVYSLAPWSRWARAQCGDMCAHSQARGRRHSLEYAACCVLCSAGVMVPVVVLGMWSPWWMVAGTAVMIAYKVDGWTALTRPT